MSDANDFSWLDTDTPTTVVSSPVKLTREKKRAPTMQGHMLGKKRVWASDGEFVYFRRKKANPATLARHNKFLQSGDYVHTQTQDDVEIYQLRESSPFKRPALDLTTLDNYNVRRQAVLAACRRDWPTFVDGLEEVAFRCKGFAGSHVAQGELIYGENLKAIFLAIAMREGPHQSEIDREVGALRGRRGEHRSRTILLPT